MDRKKETILKATAALTENYKNEELFMPKNDRSLPSRAAIIDIVKELRSIIFPGYFWNDSAAKMFPEYFAGYRLNDLYDRLKEQIEVALLYAHPEMEQPEAAEQSDRICAGFFEQLPNVQQKLLKDVQAGFDGDPAAKSKEEIISSYPGLFAIFVYRIAHELYTQDVPFLPRIMTEYAHSRTGIDINSGAKIGEYFFIDHGTGVVIGETTEIGNNVKLYQGVTLGALSTRSGQKLKGKKRHPTIKDNVTVYSGASILGGETEIGEGVIVAGGAFVTKSVPAHTKVIVKNPEIKIKDSDKKIELQTTENKEGIWEI